ncbi:hypothetical protein BHM03_00052535 [Ensete ventricosum]|nr:hypothetical protein BHM03_00052535 [Ensete ventricosum]
MKALYAERSATTINDTNNVFDLSSSPTVIGRTTVPTGEIESPVNPEAHRAPHREDHGSYDEIRTVSNRRSKDLRYGCLSPVAPNRETPLEAEPPQHQLVEAHTASPTVTPAWSQSRSCDPVQTGPDLDTLSSDTVDSLREQVHQVHQWLDEVQKEVLKSRGEIGESSKGGSSFTLEIQGKPLPATLRLPTLEPYDGSDDPTEHIVAFRAQMALYDKFDALMCRAFSTTLRGPARTWYSCLKPASISLFDLLAKEFELNFLASARPKPTTASLLGLVQGSDAPLSQFVGRFTSQVRGIPDLHPSLAIQAFLTGLRPLKFFWSLIERPPATLPEMLQRAHQYMVAKTLVAGKRDETKHPWAPNPMKSHSERRDKRRYCRFHREYDHDTEECRDLQYQIEDLIRRGHLRRYVRD